MNITTQLTHTPDEYRNCIADFISLYAERRHVEIESLDPALNYDPIPAATLAGCGLAITLTHVANAAAGNLDHHPDGDDEDYLIDDVGDIVARLFDPPVPGYAEVTQAPAEFWDTPLGVMCARALLWAYEGLLVTLQEAADIARVSVQAISQAVEAGRLTRFVDPDAPERQGRTLVLKRQVTDEPWKPRLTHHKSNRYRKPEKREAYEAALEAAEQTDDLGYSAHVSLQILAEDAGLSPRDAKDVASKAIRVERHRRAIEHAERQHALATRLANAVEDKDLNSPATLETLTEQLIATGIEPIKALELAQGAIAARRYFTDQEEPNDQP